MTLNGDTCRDSVTGMQLVSVTSQISGEDAMAMQLLQLTSVLAC